MNAIPFYYFAYGSNLPYLRMLDRTSNDVMLKGKFAWAGYRLTFTKRSVDGSGKCTVTASTRDQVVWGAIYQLTLSDKKKLVKAEGGYHEQSLLMPIDGVQQAGFTFVADQNQVDPSLSPYSWYKRLVLAGAREHGFPADYITAIDRTAALTDPNHARREKFEALLASIEGAPKSRLASL